MILDSSPLPCFLACKPRASGDDPAVHMAIESELW